MTIDIHPRPSTRLKTESSARHVKDNGEVLHDTDAYISMREWAEWRELKLSRRHACVAGLFQMGCQARSSRTESMGCYDGDHSLFDHCSLWNHDGKPAVLVSQPYGLGSFASLNRLESELGCHIFVQARSWHYPAHTLRVEIWHPDAQLWNPEYPSSDLWGSGKRGELTR